jgi:outer membrane autotransporter protein
MGISNLQNGALVGATSQFYKKDFFAGVTANVGYMHNSASTMFGNDEFNTLYASTAVRFGNNFEKGKFIFQPNMTIGYGFANTFDYTAASGVDITSTPLHTIHFAPELKVIANLQNGWQPYTGLSTVWNVATKSNVYANDVQLPDLSAKPYVQYNLGVQKAWNERYSGYLQASARSGGRTGVGFSAGLNVALGKDHKKKEDL